MRFEQFQPAHQHIEQLLARGLLRHVGVDPSQHGLVDLLDVSGEDCKRRTVLGAQIRKRNLGALGKLGQADLLERLFLQQCEHRRDDLFPVGIGR